MAALPGTRWCINLHSTTAATCLRGTIPLTTLAKDGFVVHAPSTMANEGSAPAILVKVTDLMIWEPILSLAKRTELGIHKIASV